MSSVEVDESVVWGMLSEPQRLAENTWQMPWPLFVSGFGPSGRNPGTRSSPD
jgi:hypothetical protein